MGTIFSILPARANDNPFVGPRSSPARRGLLPLWRADEPHCDLRRRGRRLHARSRLPDLAARRRRRSDIPSGTPEFAINVSNYRHWDPAVRTYVDDCISGIGRAARARLQHALARRAGRRGVPHPVARRRLSLSRRQPQDPSRRTAAPALRGASDRLSRSSRPAARASTGRARILDQRVFSLHQRTPLHLRIGRESRADRTSSRGAGHLAPTARRCSARAVCFGSRASRCRSSIPSSRSPALQARARLRSSGRSRPSSAARTSRRPISKATASIATTARRCAGGWLRRRWKATSTSAISLQKPICSKIWRRRFAPMRATGEGKLRVYVHDDVEAAAHGAAPGDVHALAADPRRHGFAVLRRPARRRRDR